LFENIGNLNDALAHYKKALECDNTSVNIYMFKGNIYVFKIKHKVHYIVLIWPSSMIHAYIYVGSIKKVIINYTEAICAYEFVLQLKPRIVKKRKKWNFIK